MAELNARNENIVEEARTAGAHEIAMSRSECKFFGLKKK